MAQLESYTCEPTDPDCGRPATIIFLHGCGDDAEGIPLGIAHQFQWHSKLPFVRWVLPNAPYHLEAMTRAWYIPKALPNPMKPRVPGHEDDQIEPDDEKGILKSVETVDELVQAELNRGMNPNRIIIGGFSQGCAISLVWGLVGRLRERVGGIMCLSGYFPLADSIEILRKDLAQHPDTTSKGSKKWFYVHGTKDMLVSTKFFEHGKAELATRVPESDIESHLYQNMGHSTCNAELRDMLKWLEKLVPP